MAKQELSSKASAAKKARDIAAAKTPLRRARKAQNQRIGQSSNRDIHHKSDGSVVKVSIKNNRGNFGKGTKLENMKQPFKLKYTDGKKASPTKMFSEVEGVGQKMAGKLPVSENVKKKVAAKIDQKVEQKVNQAVEEGDDSMDT
tara:strand:- start:2942 stop:3373 length:432 start_codon:yes stop_codon:yes gene_type:complete